MWWPSGGYAQIFVEVLLELRIPFVQFRSYFTRMGWTDEHDSTDLRHCFSPHGYPTRVHKQCHSHRVGHVFKMGASANDSESSRSYHRNHGGSTHLPLSLGHRLGFDALRTKHCPRVPCTGQTHVSSIYVSFLLSSKFVARIAWPLTFDQPPGAAHMSLTLDVAFELVQVRQGEHGLKPLYRGVRSVGTAEAVKAEVEDVLKRLHGEEGARKRRNAKKVRDEFRAGWQEDGAALRDFRNLLSAICDPNITM